MAKLFQPLGITAKGNILPLKETKLFLEENKTIDSERIQPLIIEAEKLLEKPIKVLTASLYREFHKSGDRGKYESALFQRRQDLLWLFIAEYYERAGRFSEKIADFVWAIMEESSWEQPASYQNNNAYGREYTLPASFGPDRLHGIALVSGDTAGLLALVYYYLKDEMDAISPVICEKIKYSIHERITIPFLHCSFWWEGNHNKTNNWAPWIASNVLTAVALTEENAYVRERTLAKALNVIDNFVDIYGIDGSCDEGTTYWSHAGASLFDCLEILYDISGGKINVYDQEIVRKIGEYLVKMNIDGRKYVNFADANSTMAYNGHFLYRYGKKCASDYLMSFGRMQADLGEALPDFRHPTRLFRNYMANAEDGGTLKIPTNIYLRDVKIMVRREYEKTDTGLYLAIKGGHNGESHNHNDVGSFVIYKNAKPVIIDPGAGEYTRDTFSANRYKLWQHQSHYHNLPAFGGVGQRAGTNFASSEEVYNEAEGSLTLELKNAYESGAGILSYKRYARLKDSEITFIEDVRLEEEKEIDFRYILPEAPTLRDDGTILLGENAVMTPDPSLTAEVEEFEPTRLWSWSGNLYRLHLKATAKECKLKITVK